MDSVRRVGYYDFKAYTEHLTSGRFQGFVLVRHHLMTGTVQTVFRAGRPMRLEEEAFALAEGKLSKLAMLASEAPGRWRGGLPRAA
jgi:hypothetical protein